MSPIVFTLRQLEYFDAIASEGTLAAAAERCRVSAPGLALALDELERHLSLQLFIRRKGKGMTLTAAGSRMLPHARRLLSDADALTADAGRSTGTLTGRFSIGCFPTLTPFFLPSILERFQRRYPELELDVVEADAPAIDELLLRGRIDVALLYSVDVAAHLAFDPVHHYRPHVLVSQQHRFASRPGIHLAELAEEPLISLDVHPTRRNTERVFEALGVTPTIGHVSSNYELVRCLVGRGLGYAVMFQKAATQRTYDGHIVTRIDLLDEVAPSVVGLARPAGAPRTARYAALFDFLASTSVARDADDPDRPPRTARRDTASPA
ncbi:MAG TPA: LysR family transcriptional regulator [Microbacterium sp.]|uniref:LysR family transcriptional regulator n=1 Tax=Microbacterium sp. TaxID=51671 RepID=UPI002D14A99A|nr:LysR family transcriptional regulator [Microbacterium sp.]HWI31797.1 LysR family transcriptional regulator [Microbacterium sp.]